MNHLTLDDSFASVLELAANNDLDGFKRCIDRDISVINEVGNWYGRKKVIEQRTPLMVAATYGSIDVVNLILKFSSIDINRYCGPDKTTALHCAASGGSVNAVEVVKALLSAGANPNCIDANGDRPADVIAIPLKLSDAKAALEELLGSESQHCDLLISTCSSNFRSSVSSTEEDGSPSSESASSPMPEKKEYPIDPSLPDIKNSIYATDEFRMFSFKVRPCSRAYSHDWTECPFVHPGENARRRDPRKYHYSCVPCPDFRKGTCRRGDMCEYAHGVFECWLHPAQYRTRLCKDGTNCTRRVCFFAHTNEELRPLHVSTGSAVPSPRSSAMEMAAMGLMPGSPSAVSSLMSPFTPPMSPSTNGISHSSFNWPQPSVPSLHLSGSNLQSSRLRSSLNARDILPEDYLTQDFETQQLINDLVVSRLSSVVNRAARTKSLNASNLEELFSAEVSSSPRYSAEQGTIFSPSHKAAIFNQFQQQQSLLSPIKTRLFSPKSIDQPLSSHSSLLQSSLGMPSPGIMSPRTMDAGSPISARLAAFAQREKQQQQSLRSLSSRELGVSAAAILGSPTNSVLSRLGSSSQTTDWFVNDEDHNQLRRASPFDLCGGEEPDVSWVHSLVKEPSLDKPMPSVTYAEPSPSIAGPKEGARGHIESRDHAAVLRTWLDLVA